MKTRISILQQYMAALAKRLPAEPQIVEVGSYTGRSSAVFAQHAGALWCVDSYSPGYDPNDLASDPARLAAAERAFDSVAAAHPNIMKIRETSVVAAAKFMDCSLDFVYIDACHLYEAVRTDIAAWLPKIKIGGIIGGHDYGDPVFPGVQRAVQESFGTVEHDGYGNWALAVQYRNREDILRSNK